MLRWIITTIIAVPFGLYAQTTLGWPYCFVFVVWAAACVITGIFSLPKPKGPDQQISRKGRDGNDIDHLLK